MTEEAHATWRDIIGQLMELNIALYRDKSAAVGKGEYRMHTQRSPNTKRPAHE
jgi:hypothetical protein